MYILQSPFHILNVTIYDNKIKINEAAEEKSLFDDSDESHLAMNTLITPSKRLAAELSWICDLSEEDIEEVILLLENSPKDLKEYIDSKSYSTLTDSNILSSALSKIEGFTSTELSDWIQTIAYRFEDIDPDEVMDEINNYRNHSRFPNISDISQVEKELDVLKNYHRQVILNSLDKLPTNDMLDSITMMIEEATVYGTSHAPVLLESLIDSFEVEAQAFLLKEEENIDLLLKEIYNSLESKKPDNIIINLIEKLIEVVKNWDLVAQPIQVCKMSQGLEDAQSKSISQKIRKLSISLHNNYKKTELSHKLTEMLQEVFAEVASVVELAEKDSETLIDIINNANDFDRFREEIKAKSKNINFEIKIGLFFKDTLTISGSGISWKNKFYPFDSIVSYRFGGTRSNNSATYRIILSTKHDGKCEISLSSANNFGEILTALWLTVGLLLFVDYLEGLASGKKYIFGNTIISADGITLEKNIFLKTEKVFCEWHDISTYMKNGQLYIQKKSDTKVFSSLDVLKVENVYVLEHLVKHFKNN